MLNNHKNSLHLNSLWCGVFSTGAGLMAGRVITELIRKRRNPNVNDSVETKCKTSGKVAATENSKAASLLPRLLALGKKLEKRRACMCRDSLWCLQQSTKRK